MQEIPAAVSSWRVMQNFLFYFFISSGERKIRVYLFSHSEETTKLKLCCHSI